MFAVSSRQAVSSNETLKFIDLFMVGWFNAYGYAAHNTSAEIFLHLGDYVRTVFRSGNIF